MGLQSQELSIPGYEKVVKFTEEKSKLKAIIAIHNTDLGPGLGGTRIYPYKTFDHALTDVLRLSKGMTYKAAIAQVGLGGAKSVIIADPKKDKTKDLLYAFGEAVNSYKGIYICAEDVGCTPEDVEIILKKTKYACGVHNLRGSGNPAGFTAWGIFQGIKSVLQEIEGNQSLKGKTIAIQGIGNVGSRLIEHLFWEGARLIIADTHQEIVNFYAHKFNAKIVESDEILSVKCDILSPCAMGGILNKATIPKLNCKAIAGGANNQLLISEDADHLKERNILYAPDFVINAGGLINVMHELHQEGYQASLARNMTYHIYDQLLNIYEIAQQNQISTHQAALSIAEHRIKQKIGKRREKLCFRFSQKEPSHVSPSS